MKDRVVLAVIGAHGSGKTTFLEYLQDQHDIPYFSTAKEAHVGFVQHFNDRHSYHFGFRLTMEKVPAPGEVLFDYTFKDRIRHLMDEYSIAERKEAEDPAIFTHRATDKALANDSPVVAIADMLHPAEMQSLACLENATTIFIELTAEKRIGTEFSRGKYGPLQRIRDIWIDYHKPHLETEGRYFIVENNGTAEEFQQTIANFMTSTLLPRIRQG